jgi:hypothetical protein
MEAQGVQLFGTTGSARSYAFVDLSLPTGSTGGFVLHRQLLSLGLGATFRGGASDALLWRH